MALATSPPERFEAVVMERIRELLRFRHWYRSQPNWAVWMDLARDNDVRLRELVRLARESRREPVATFTDHPADATWADA